MANPRISRIETVAVFVLVFIVASVAMAVFWEGTMVDEVYHCTDAFVDYFTPGSWVHGDWVYVNDVKEELMNADTLLVGWTIGRLWTRWLSMFGVTLVFSALLTYLYRVGVGKA